MKRNWTRLLGIAAVTAAVMAGAFMVGGGGGQAVKAAVAEPNQYGGGSETWMMLRIDGQLIEGDTYREARKGLIEVLAFEQSVTTAREAGSGMATGRRQYQPLLIRKRIDKASPLLMRALTMGQTVEASFGFFRPNPTGDGTDDRFYEIGIRGARVASIKIVQESSGPPMEEVTFVFHNISWTYTNGGVTHEDTWDQGR